MDKPFLDGFSHPLRWQRLPQDSTIFSVNCTCTLLGTLEDLVFAGSGHFIALHAVACCKGSKYFLVSSGLLTPVSFACFFFQMVLDPIVCFCGECRSQRQALHTDQAERRKTISMSQQGKDSNVSSTLPSHQKLYIRESPGKYPRCGKATEFPFSYRIQMDSK